MEPVTQRFNQQQGVDHRPCDNCGSRLEFSIGQQELACQSCGYSEQIVHTEGTEVNERDFAGLTLRHANSLTGAQRPEPDSPDSAIAEKEFVCQNCGGQSTFVGSLTATRCPYCATSIQHTDVHAAPDRLPVDGILPFSLDKSGASEALEDWVNRRWFAPNQFKKYSTAGSFQSVYAAYFTYDAHATTDYRGQRGNHRQIQQGSGKNARTVTVTDWRRTSGTVYNSFDDMTILANTGFNPKYVANLEPWPTDRLRPYHSDYIAGHLCRTYDRDATECFVHARQRMDAVIDRTIKRDIGGDAQRVDFKDTHLRDLTYKHALLPIWLLTVVYNGQPWQVFMNGVTGEVHGQRPLSKAKIIMAVAVAVVLAILMVLIWNAASQ